VLPFDDAMNARAFICAGARVDVCRRKIFLCLALNLIAEAHNQLRFNFFTHAQHTRTVHVPPQAPATWSHGQGGAGTIGIMPGAAHGYSRHHREEVRWIAYEIEVVCHTPGWSSSKSCPAHKLVSRQRAERSIRVFFGAPVLARASITPPSDSQYNTTAAARVSLSLSLSLL
jgi:hypothetical protein